MTSDKEAQPRAACDVGKQFFPMINSFTGGNYIETTRENNDDVDGLHVTGGPPQDFVEFQLLYLPATQYVGIEK